MFSKFLLLPVIALALTAGFKSPDIEPATASVQVADSANAPEIQFVPAVTDIPETSEKFLIREIKVLNKGGGPLVIKSVTPSCGCAAAAVMNSTINPMGIGKIRLSMNTAGMNDTLNRVEFVIESNAKNSPTLYSAFVRVPKKTTVVE